MSEFALEEIAAERAAPETATPDGRGGRRSVPSQLLHNPLAVFSLAWLVIIIIVAIGAPWLAPYEPTFTKLDATNAPPFTPGHPLGGDAAGRDILSRLMWGSRQTVIAAVIVLAVSATIGVLTGLAAGFYRGKIEGVAGFLSDTIMSLPSIVLLIALYSLTGPNIPIAMAVFGVLVAPVFYRMVRSVTLGTRNELYVDAARVVGLSDLRIVGRHVLWAVRAPVIIQSTFILAAGIGIEAGVTFLGLGDPAGTSWGLVMQNAFNGIYNNPKAIVGPALVITLTILSLILFGNALSDALQSSARSKPLPPRRRRQVLAAARVQDPEATADTTQVDREVVLAVRGLRIAYPTPDGEVREVVHGVDLDLRRGQIHALVGESGSGKSQIAFSTLGILPAEALILGGSVLLDGEDLLADPARDATSPGSQDRVHPAGTDVQPRPELHRRQAARLRAEGGDVVERQGHPTSPHRPAHPGRDHRSRTRHGSVSPRDLRRHGPARAHLRRGGRRSGHHRRGRADHSPGCHRAGRGAGAAA